MAKEKEFYIDVIPYSKQKYRWKEFILPNCKYAKYNFYISKCTIERMRLCQIGSGYFLHIENKHSREIADKIVEYVHKNQKIIIAQIEDKEKEIFEANMAKIK